MVIGQIKNSRCFLEYYKIRLPATYKLNKSAKMTSNIFETELRKWNTEFKGQGAKNHPTIKFEEY